MEEATRIPGEKNLPSASELTNSLAQGSVPSGNQTYAVRGAVVRKSGLNNFGSN